MILVGSQRSGAHALADHLMNDRDNEHVEMLEIDGFMASDLHGALDEAHAIAGATRCQKFLFSVSLNPPEGVVVTDDGFREAVDRVAEKLGLSEQPRAMVIHEKNGRRHAHAVWSRIDGEDLKAIELGLYKSKLRDLSKDLFLDHGWELPNGLRTYGHKNPLNFTLAEWQQAQRVGVDPREMKQLFREAWDHSDDLRSYKAALEDKGLYLAKGDRRGFVALDVHGTIYSVSRWSNVKVEDATVKLGSPDPLPSVEQATQDLRHKINTQVLGYIRQVKAQHEQEMQPFYEERAQLVTAHRKERSNLKTKQDQRWQDETATRHGRLNRRLRGLFDRLTGSHHLTQRRNESEAMACAHRDQDQRDQLVEAQMRERSDLQARVSDLKLRHRKERRHMAKTVAEYMRRPLQEQSPHDPNRRRNRTRGPTFDR